MNICLYDLVNIKYCNAQARFSLTPNPHPNVQIRRVSNSNHTHLKMQLDYNHPHGSRYCYIIACYITVYYRMIVWGTLCLLIYLLHAATIARIYCPFNDVRDAANSNWLAARDNPTSLTRRGCRFVKLPARWSRCGRDRWSIEENELCDNAYARLT